MTTISTAATVDVGAVPKAKSRNLALDRARTFLTLVVLLHHAVIPYTYFGHTDPKSWIGFDMIVLVSPPPLCNVRMRFRKTRMPLPQHWTMLPGTNS